MKKFVLIIIFLILLVLSLTLFFFRDSFLDLKNNFPVGSKFESGKTSFGDEEKSSDDNNQTNGGSEIEETESLGVEGIRNGNDGERESPLNESPERESECILIRPGNLPDIICSVNYISPNEVSIKIKNEIGKKIGVVIRIEKCGLEIFKMIENNEEKDFVFPCNNRENFFNEEVLISYIIDNSEKVDIGGFIQGFVSY